METVGSPRLFGETSSRPGVVLALFIADWSAPCAMMGSVLVRIAAESPGEIYAVAVNSEVEEELATLCRIHRTPTMLIYRSGVEVDRIEGTRAADVIRTRVHAALATLPTHGEPPSEP